LCKGPKIGVEFAGRAHARRSEASNVSPNRSLRPTFSLEKPRSFRPQAR
jgi:hypothetical protein